MFVEHVQLLVHVHALFMHVRAFMCARVSMVDSLQ